MTHAVRETRQLCATLHLEHPFGDSPHGRIPFDGIRCARKARSPSSPETRADKGDMNSSSFSVRKSIEGRALRNIKGTSPTGSPARTEKKPRTQFESESIAHHAESRQVSTRFKGVFTTVVLSTPRYMSLSSNFLCSEVLSN